MSDLPYDDPFLRSNSPSDSLSTEYGPDETTQAEKELSTAEFTCRVESTHHLHVAREAELVAEQSPLLPPLNQGDEKDEKGEYLLHYWEKEGTFTDISGDMKFASSR